MRVGIILTDAINVFKGSTLKKYRLLQALLEQEDPGEAISNFIGKKTYGLLRKKDLQFIPRVTTTYCDVVIKGILINSSKFILAYRGTLDEVKEGQVFIAEDSDLIRIFPESCLNSAIVVKRNGLTIATIENDYEDEYEDDRFDGDDY